MGRKIKLENDFYVIGEDFRLIAFNKAVEDRYAGIKVGDYCYKAVMNRESPCLYCPIAGNTDNDSPIYFSPFYNGWVEAVFSEIAEGKYSVTCRPAQESGLKIIGEKGNEELKAKTSGKAANEQLEEQVREQMAIITGLAAEYYSVILVDYERNKVRIYRANGEDGRQIADFFSSYDSWSEAVREYADTLVVKEERKAFCRALSLESIQSAEEDCSFNYQKLTDKGISHLQFKVASVEVDERNRFALIATRNIDKEFENQTKFQQVQRDLARSYSVIFGLSQEYHTVWLVTVEDRTMHLFRATQNASVPGAVKFGLDSADFDTAMKQYVGKYVDEPDRERMCKAVSLDSLMQNVPENGLYTVPFVQCDEAGNRSYQQVAFVRAKGEDGTENIVFGFRDVDSIVREEQKKQKVLQDALAAAEHANRSKTTFLNNMSHDIRTPMNAIIGFTSLAAAHIDNAEQVQSYLNKIQISSKHLLSLINDVLDMSHIESGKVKIEEKEAHLPEVLHDLRTIVQADITSKQLEFHIDSVDVVNEDVICDKLRLNQVLMNILSNAMKFTKPGGTVSLRVVQRQDAPKGYANYEFHVKDTGIGMSRKFLQHVFEPFERESTTTVSGIQGTGLGMAITKNIVDMMGGTITVESEPGKGTEFIVNLMLKIVTDHVKCEAIPQLEGLRILIADDDSDACMSICKMLANIGVRSEWTSSGKEAVIRTQFAIEQNDEFYAYIIDWLMPDMNGVEVVRRIRHIVGKSKPIIVLTAYDWADIEVEAREAGVSAFCSKPLFLSELREALSEPYRVEQEIEEKEPEEKEPEQIDFTGRKLLLVEDNELNQEIAIEILKGAGFTIDVADDGVVAVDKVQNAAPGQYDLILMDIQMPIMDGYEATKRIRALENPELASIPIIAMTANAFEEDRKKALDCGMNEHVKKPIDIKQLLQKIAEFL